MNTENQEKKPTEGWDSAESLKIAKKMPGDDESTLIRELLGIPKEGTYKDTKTGLIYVIPSGPLGRVITVKLNEEQVAASRKRDKTKKVTFDTQQQ